MNKKVLNTLEFNKILDILSNYTTTYLGKDLCYLTNVSTDINEISNRLISVTQMQYLIIKNGSIPLCPINNINPSLKKIEMSGILNFKELIDIAHILKISRELKQYFNDDFEFEKYQNISLYFTNLYSNNRIENLILDNILDEETINDNASTNLASIRKSLKQIENKIRDTLNNYITSSTYQKYIQDNIITSRNNRFVIPIKQEYRSQIKGLIHDTSSSGSTLFIEPTNIVEMNNKIRELEIEEKKEIEKILYQYSLEIAQILNNLIDNLKYIANIDFIAAKAKYGLNSDMFEPKINNKKYIQLINARHPLIPKENVVPISLEITNNFNCMIITGPNTGGKTVTLKTIGLFTLMTQYGMHIPACEGSEIAIFNNIFTDIGDEQSIEQSLSTFSSHITTIINITKNIKPNSLVILDELGSGTDPVEGAALAIGILEYLNSQNSITICSTHYSELKTYAISKENILNACTEFDIKTLKPTYKLILGIPGKSNAFAISQKLGLSKEILDNSSTYITKNISDFEDIVIKINNEKNEIEKIKRNIQSEYSKIKDNSTYLETEKEKLNKNKNKIIETAKIEAKQLLLDSKQQINEMINELYSLKTNSPKEIQRRKTIINDKINKSISNLNENNNDIINKLSNDISINDIKIGQTIYIPHLNKEATILDITNNSNIQVQIGIIKTKVSLNDIKLINHSEKEKNSIKIKIENKAQTISSSINVLGKNVDEAIYEIDKYLDDAYLAKIGIITIIHGKGTGKLKDGIHQYLKNNKYVKSYRLGSYSEGQNGVTIVELI